MLKASLTLAISPLVIALGCSGARYSTEPGAPTLVLPAHFAEGSGESSAKGAAPRAPAASTTGSASAAPAASGAAPAGTPPTPSTAPDPTPLRMAEQVEYELELTEGKIHVVSVKALKLAEPIVTPRRIGRYAIELSIGHELLERVRFDFPGTAADEPQVGTKKALYAPLTLSEHAIAHIKVLVPQSPRVRRATLIDRGTSTATELDWPLPSVPQKTPRAADAAPAAPAGPATSAAPPQH